MGITETGYYRSTYEDILSELTAKAQELFGEDIDVSELTPLGKLLNIMAYVRAKDHELAELIYYSRFPNTANGISLDRLCPFLGLTRNTAIPSRYTVTATGEEGTTIPVGFLVSTESDITFYTTEEKTIAAGETTCTITVECTTEGTIGNVAAKEINEIVNPEAGIDSVVGVSIVSAGEDEESDYELRKRIEIASEGSGSGNASSIRAALIRIPTVESAVVIVNDSNSTDSKGNEPHSIAVYVAGGENYSQEIAEAIFNTKPAGIQTNGTIIKTVTDNGGYTHQIKYNKMQTVNVTVAVSIVTTVDFETTGIETIKNNIKNYINSFGFGDDVIYSTLYGYIYAVKGVEKVTELKLSTDGTTFTTNDIEISILECARCDTVTVTEVS